MSHYPWQGVGGGALVGHNPAEAHLRHRSLVLPGQGAGIAEQLRPRALRLPGLPDTAEAALRGGPRQPPCVIPARRVIFEENFIDGINWSTWGTSTSATSYIYLVDPAGSGSDARLRRSILRLDTQATIGNYAHFFSHANGFVLGEPGLELELSIRFGAAIITNGIVRVGWGDATGGADLTDGCGFEFDHSAHATHWYRETSAASSRTKSSSGIVATQNAWVTLRIRWHSATAVELFQGNTSLGTATATLPTGDANSCGLHLFARCGATNGYVYLDVDWLRVTGWA